MRFHTLVPAETPVPAGAASAPGTVAIVLEPIRLPAQVDQPQWFVRLPDGAVAVLEQDRWASPLRDELRQALLERLTVRWAASTARPASGQAAPVRIGIEVRRFDSVMGRESRIEGTWSLSTGEVAAPRSAQCDWSLRESSEAGTDALEAAHQRAVGRLGDMVGEAAIKLARGQRVVCPARDNAG